MMKDIVATVIVDLTPSCDEILKGLHKDARWGIGKARKAKLQIVENRYANAEFYDVYSAYMDYRGLEKLSYGDLSTDLVMFSCLKEDKVIAVASLKLQRGMPTLNINASLEEFRNLQPNNLLYWACILWAKGHGYQELDLGGWQINARDNAVGVNAFKERFGKIVYYYEDFPFWRAIGRKLIRRYAFFWSLNKLLRGRR